MDDSTQFLGQPAQANRLGDILISNLERDWTHFRAAIAFVKRSGVKHIAGPLSRFAKSRTVEIIAGIDHGGTSYEGLRDLLAAVQPTGRLIVFHNRLPHTFHPKVYVFKSATAAEVVTGSGNLTEGGLFTNYEASIRLCLDLAVDEQATNLRSIEEKLDQWSQSRSGTARVLDEDLLRTLRDVGLVPVEASSRGEGRGSNAPSSDFDSNSANALFPAESVHRAPAAATPATRPATATGSVEFGVPAASSPGNVDAAATRFVMTLQRTDAGVGQTSPGTSKRSPEIFIPLSARNANPDFWDWPHGFTADAEKPGKLDRQGVQMRFAGRTVLVNMMTWPDKHDFRLRSAALRDSGHVGDILRIEKVEPHLDFEYYVEIIPKDTEQHTRHLIHCTGVVPGKSRKRWGYF